MKKFAFIGAGSFSFTRTIIRDLLTYPAFFDCELCLMDIDEEKLTAITAAVQKIVTEMKSPAKVTATLSRAAALSGADGVLCTVFNGGVDIWRYDIEIPKQFGVDINIGDTRSVSGIFRALRNIPLMLDICRDIQTYCPNAVFLNYTNPMAMLCKAMQTYSNIEVTGICHSVQGTIEMLASWLGYPVSEIDYLCAGVNHQAFYLKLEREGQDLYPLLRQKIEDPNIYNKEIVRNEMFRYLGYYVTESSGHNSEYNAWFRKRPDLIETYCTHGTGWNPGIHRYSLDLHIEREAKWREQLNAWMKEPIDQKRSKEYATEIFNARFGDHTPAYFNGNVLNHGSISNLPAESCVEIPAIADRAGIHPMMVGALPAHLAILVNTTTRIENLVVEAAMEKSKRKVFEAVAMDPLTSAVCSLAEIHEMCNLLFEKNAAYLGDYKA